MSDLISFGSFASVQYFANSSNNIVAANQGDLQGAIWARITSEPRDIGNGQRGFTMQHEFVCTDGSTIETTDTAVQTAVYGGDEATLTVVHDVVNSSGRFAGKRGSFTSFGVHNTKNGQGVQRFAGTLS